MKLRTDIVEVSYRYIKLNLLIGLIELIYQISREDSLAIYSDFQNLLYSHLCSNLSRWILFMI